MWSKVSRATSVLCCVTQVAKPWSFAVGRFFCSSQGEVFYEVVHPHQWAIMIIVQEQNQCEDITVSSHCLSRSLIYN